MNKNSGARNAPRDFRLSSSTLPKKVTQLTPVASYKNKEKKPIEDLQHGLSYFEEMIKELDRKLASTKNQMKMASSRQASPVKEKNQEFNQHDSNYLESSKELLGGEKKRNQNDNARNDDVYSATSSSERSIHSSLSKKQLEKMPMIGAKRPMANKRKKNRVEGPSPGIFWLFGHF